MSKFSFVDAEDIDVDEWEELIDLLRLHNKYRGDEWTTLVSVVADDSIYWPTPEDKIH